MANHALARRPQGLIGEIVDGRYAVLELLGGNRYLVFDLKELRQTVMPLGNEGSVLGFETAAVQPAAQAARPAEPSAPSLPRLAPLRGKAFLPPLPNQTRSRPPSGASRPVLRQTAPAVPEQAAPAAPEQAAPSPVALTQRKTPPPPPVELTQRKAPVALEQVKLKPQVHSLAPASKASRQAVVRPPRLSSRSDKPVIAASLPNAPRLDATPMPPLQRRRVDTHRFEAAWFSHGELLENEEQVTDEVTDYDAYQSYLERIALKQS